MSVSAAVLEHLVDDEALESRLSAAAISEHRRHRAAPYGAMIGSLVVGEHALGELSRLLDGPAVRVCAVAAAGAGSLLSLGRRDLPGVEIVAIRTELRDLDDLPGNAARVVAAAESLPDAVEVFVGLPPAPGWVAAAEAVEAAGLYAAVGAACAEQLAEQLSVLIETDLPFTVTNAPHGVVPLLLAVDALVDGADQREAAELLDLDDDERIAAATATWDEAAAVRIRRRLRSVAVTDVGRAVRELGLVDVRRS